MAAAAALGLGALSLATAVSVHATAAAEAIAPTAPARALSEIQLAIEARPDRETPWLDRANWQQDDSPAESQASARQALARDPRDWRAWRLLGTLDFGQQHPDQAREDFEQAAHFGNGFAAHYALANFAILLGDAPEFWRQLRAALAVAPPEDAGFAVNQAFAFAAGPADPRLEAAIPTAPPRVLAQVMASFLDHHAYVGAAVILGRTECGPGQLIVCQSATFQLVNTLYDMASQTSGEGSALLVNLAGASWLRAAREGWVEAADRNPSNLCPDGDFLSPWHGDAFSWQDLGQVTISRRLPGPDPAHVAVGINFDGQEPENAELLRQFVALTPGSRYKVGFRSRSTSAEGGVGLWVQGQNQKTLALVPARERGTWGLNTGTFTVPPDMPLVGLSFRYVRPSGQIRIHVPVQIADVELQAAQ